MSETARPGLDGRLAEVASTWATTIVDAVTREYPNHLRHLMSGPDDRPTPREAHPAFYGCLDWHSAVEMHWALICLLRRVPDALDATAVRAVLDEHLTADALATEAAYLRTHPGWERPYGWGWALTLAAELADWSDDADAQRWSADLRPLADVIVGGFLRWLPLMTYPTRDGAHANSAFGCVRSVAWARQLAADGDTRLIDSVGAVANRWFADDVDYPAGWEPGGADFLSPALTEAELMLDVLDRPSFVRWLDRFLPGLAKGEPDSLVRPAVVSDATDGQIAHLHGLNLSRAAAFRRLAAALPDDDLRSPVLLHAAVLHDEASLPSVTGSDYMVEHWLACYAVLGIVA